MGGRPGLRQAAHDWSPHRLRLVYSNRRPEDAAFLAELQGLERKNKNFRLLATMTNMGESSSNWDGETRFVAADLLHRFVGDLAAPAYSDVVGPPAMVEAMQETLSGAGVAEDNIRTEEFYGY